MAKLLNREALAARLEISPARVQQLTGLGVLTRHERGYDIVECAIALAKYVRRDEAQKAARTRLITTSAAIGERRQRQALRQLVTLEEVRATMDDAFGQAMGQLQAGSSSMFAELMQLVGDDKARYLTCLVYNAVLGALHQFREASAAAIEQLRDGLHQGRRLDDVIEELRHAVSADGADGEDA
jgi:hypothetical protein